MYSGCQAVRFASVIRAAQLILVAITEYRIRKRWLFARGSCTVLRLYRWVGWAETLQSGVSACAPARSHLHINSSQCAFTNCDTSVFYRSNINFVRTSFMIHTGRGRGIPLVNIMYTGRVRNIPSGVSCEHTANCPSLVATPAPHSTASSHNAQ